LAAKTSQNHSYQDFVHALKSVVGAKSPAEFPRLMVITGSSNFLHMKACHAVKAAWETLDVGEAQSIEASDLDQSKFMSLWSQVSLFEPDALYIIRRAGGIKGLGSWLAAIKTPEAIKSHIVIDCADKLPADVLKQVTRLKAVVIHGAEPTGMVEFQKVAHSLARRAGVDLDDDSIKLLIESMGMDLGKVENEIVNLSLRFADKKERLTRADIAGSIGSLREDDVFELFDVVFWNSTF
jgi:DNA polymerase III delta subunit